MNHLGNTEEDAFYSFLFIVCDGMTIGVIALKSYMFCVFNPILESSQFVSRFRFLFMLQDFKF